MLFQAVFIGGTVIAIPGKAVQLPANHKRPAPVGGVLEHLLELRPLVAGAGQVPVGVDLHDPEAVLSGKQLTVSHLLLNGAVALVVGGVAGIDNGILDIRIKSCFLHLLLLPLCCGCTASRASANCPLLSCHPLTPG